MIRALFYLIQATLWMMLVGLALNALYALLGRLWPWLLLACGLWLAVKYFKQTSP